MYYDTGIQPLSAGQMKKLMSGGAVRMKMGNHTPVKLSKAQMKKMHSNNAKGKATTIMFDPYQMQMHGSGMFDFLDPTKNGVQQAFQPVADVFTPETGRYIAGEAVHKGLPIVGATLGGIAGAELGPIGSMAGSYAGSKAGEAAATKIGEMYGVGMKRGRPRKGRGFFEDVRPATDFLRPVGEAAVDRAVREIKGSGVRRRSGKGMFSDIKKGAAKALHVAQTNPLVGKIASKVMDKIPAGAKALGKYAQREYGIQGGEKLGEMAGTMLRSEIKSRTGLGMRRGGALRVAGSGMDYC